MVRADRSDLLSLYLKEAGRMPLLSPEDEQYLFAAMRYKPEHAGPYAHLDVDAAHLYLTQCNLRLVVSVARKYQDRGLPLLDLIEEGNIGLIKAANCFRSEEGCRFSTYATWWVKQAIQRALIEKDHKGIRVPSHAREGV